MGNIKKFEEFDDPSMDRPEDVDFRLRQLNIIEIDNLLDEMSECDNIGERMGIADCIIMELDANDIDTSDYEDEIKDLAID